MIQFSRIVARNSAVGLAAQLAIKVISFGFTILIVRRLGAEDYGQYAGVLAFGAMFVFLSDLGLGGYTVREIARWRGYPDRELGVANALYGNTLVLRLLLSLVATVLLIATAWLTGRPLVMIGAIALGAIGLIMYSIQGASDSLLAGFERLDLSAGSKVFNQIAFVAIGAVALWLGLGYYGLVIANLFGVAFMTYFCWQAVRRLGVVPHRAVIRSWPALLRASVPFGVIGFTLGLSYKFDSVLLNIFRGDTETGYYNAAYNLVFSAVVLSNVLNTALYPSLARHHASTGELSVRSCKRVLRYLMLLSLPVAVGTCALAGRLVDFLYTASYAPAVPALQIVIWVVPLMFASEFLGYLVLVGGDERRAARSVVASTALNVTLNLVLVPHYGFLAAAGMTVATEAILVAQYVWVLRDLLRQMEWSEVVLRPLLAALAMGGVALALSGLPLLLDIGAAALTYGALSILLGAIGRDDLRFALSLRPWQKASAGESASVGYPGVSAG